MTRFATIFTLLLLTAALPATAQTGDCAPAEAEAVLDINNVRARIFNNGALVWKGEPHVYEVPKYGETNAIFAAGIWIGGMVNGQLRTAASTYGPWEFWPGPLDDAGNPPADCAPYDRIYAVYAREINHYEETGEASSGLRDWPWQLGAPVVDGDGIPGNYNPGGAPAWGKAGRCPAARCALIPGMGRWANRTARCKGRAWLTEANAPSTRS